MLDVAVPPQWKRQWDDLRVQLRDPFKLRITVVSVIAAVGLLAIYRPLSAEIKIVARDAKLAEERLALVREIDQLRKARTKMLENLPADGDINFWSEYLLGGIRDSGVILKTLDSNYRKTKIGTLQGVYYDLEIAGTFGQIHALIRWIESNRYFARVVKLRFKGESIGVEGKMAVAVLVSPHRSSTAKSKTAAPAKSDTAKPKSAAPAKSETAKSKPAAAEPGAPIAEEPSGGA